MAVTADRLTVEDSATLLTVGTEADFTPGRTVAIYNPGPATVLLGGPAVDGDTGCPLPPGATLGAELGRGDSMYGVVATGTQDVHVLQTGV